MVSTVGAPHMWVTRSLAISWKIERRIDPPQAHVRAPHRRHRPGVAPAVAVEHRQGPEVDRARRQARMHDVADRFEKGAAVMVDDALRVAGRPRGVVQRDRRALVRGRRPHEIGVARGRKASYSISPSRSPGPGRARRRSRRPGASPELRERRPDGTRVFPVGRGAPSPRRARGCSRSCARRAAC